MWTLTVILICWLVASVAFVSGVRFGQGMERRWWKRTMFAEFFGREGGE